MCGIVALYHKDGSPVDRQVLVRMRDTLTHRGPDDAGLYVDGRVGLAHRRLSIIDLSPTGAQPMFDESGTISVVFNGEIYNYAALRQEFSARGYRFRTKSDTETILAGYVLHGESFVTKLNGIFAFALWDAPRRKMFLVRDRMGVKPLYVWCDDRLVAAASEMKALLQHPGVGRSVDEELIPEYLAFRQLAGHKTLIRGIRQLPPGQMLIIDAAAERSSSYWSIPPCSSRNEDDNHVDRVDALLAEATRMQLVADVPVGTYNSGGIDSSLITGYAAATATHRLNTFSVGFDDRRFDERPYAQMVADQYRTNHRALVVRSRDYADELPRVIWHHDEPLSHPHTVHLYLLSRFARQFVTVVLTGEGSDELFAGYPRYRSGAMLQRLGAAGRLVGAGVARVIPSRPRSRWDKTKHALVQGPLRNVIEASRWVNDEELAQVLTVRQSPIRPERVPLQPLNGDLVARMLEQDQRNYLQALLMRLDKTTMAASLEARVPFLDHRLVELAASIPTSYKLRGLQTKYVIKRLAARRLPHRVVYRRKMGFPVPLGDWLRDCTGLGRYLDNLLEPRAIHRGYLAKTGVRETIDAHRRGFRDHREILWGLINLELWHREFLENGGRTR